MFDDVLLAPGTAKAVVQAAERFLTAFDADDEPDYTTRINSAITNLRSAVKDHRRAAKRQGK